jgi:hypothetical protein
MYGILLCTGWLQGRKNPPKEVFMPSYKLNVLFDSKEDLQTIYTAKERLTLMKQTEPGATLAWIAFDPFMNNTVSWTDTYALYASKSIVEAGATIDRLDDIEAAQQKVYAFSQGAFAEGQKSSDLSAGQYKVINDYASEDWLTFGMAQHVQVNGTAYPNHPINAVVVPREHTAVFTPYEKVKVSLRAHMRNSLVVSDVSNEGLTLTYGGGVTEHTIRYESTSGKFVKVS